MLTNPTPESRAVGYTAGLCPSPAEDQPNCPRALEDLLARDKAITDVAIGALGGITGPLAAFPGAFVTVWCGMRGWDKVVQRSVYQPYILIIQILTLGGLSLSAGRSVINANMIAYALPAVAGAWLGLQVFQKMSDAQFQRLVNLALIVSGIALTLK